MIKDIQNYTNYYFLGIGGIGMSALARHFKRLGKTVLGYDKTKTILTETLEKEGIDVHYIDSTNYIIANNLLPENTLVIRTPAVPSHTKEWLYLQENNFNILKRAEVLGELGKNTFCIAIGGTHGKTTTSSIIGHLLVSANKSCSFILGGIVENYNSNYFYNGNDILIVEADEFDQSFLKLYPDIICITSMDADHLDIYKTKEKVIESFKDFANRLPENGILFAKENLDLPTNFSYGVNSKTANCNAFNIQIKEGYTEFDINTPFGKIENIKFKILGLHNIENAVVASSIALKIGLTNEEIKLGLSTFNGIKRRFNQFNIKEKVYIDDYAHHPTEINAVTDSLKLHYPNKKSVGIFQPHLYSRTKDFADDFAKSLAKFDEIIILDIYPARELPIEGITSQWLLNKVELKNKHYCTLNTVLEKLKELDFTILVTIGAGNIDTLVEPIKKWLND
ncbi:MAG: UDP-N-acetylmuramate--L-alanine ligase [Solirubrobacteraceae bacterium]